MKVVEVAIAAPNIPRIGISAIFIIVLRVTQIIPVKKTILGFPIALNNEPTEINGV